jgi:A1 cistron-splicing factor AAR2
MDNETAKHLVENGATFILLDLPVNSEFGIDYNCWRVGEQFKGIKMIPPGIHYIYYSSVDGTNGQVSCVRNGFFYDFKLKEVYAKKWDAKNECIDDTFVFSEDELLIFRKNQQNMDRFLGAYPYDQYKRWISLTNQMNDFKLIQRLSPISKVITNSTTLQGDTFSASKTKVDEPINETYYKNSKYSNNFCLISIQSFKKGTSLKCL